MHTRARIDNMKIVYIKKHVNPVTFLSNRSSLEKAMYDDGFDVNIITSSIVKNDNDSLSDIPIFRLKTINLKLGLLKTDYPYILNIKKILERLKPDIIHAHSHLFLTTYSAIMNASQLNIPNITTVHGFRAERNNIVNKIQELYLNTIAKKIFMKSNIVHCLTNYEAKLVRSIYPLSNIQVIPNYVDTDHFKPSDNKNYNLIVWSGRMIPEKGLKYLIRAMKLVFKENPSANLVLIGDGPLRKSLEKYIIQNKLTNNVVFTGWIDRYKVAEILSRSSIFVFPSLSEGMPFSLLEAMASGNSSVVSDIPQIREVVDDGINGFQATPRNYHKLADLIIQCLQDKNLTRKIASNARKKIENKYSIDVVKDRYVSMYKKLI